MFFLHTNAPLIFITDQSRSKIEVKLLIKKILPMYFEYFSTTIVTIYQEPCINFSRFLT